MASSAAWSTDEGLPIVTAIVGALRDDRIILPAADTIERIGLAGRARARKRAADRLANALDDRIVAAGLVARDAGGAEPRQSQPAAGTACPYAGHRCRSGDRRLGPRVPFLSVCPRGRRRTRIPAFGLLHEPVAGHTGGDVGRSRVPAVGFNHRHVRQARRRAVHPGTAGPGVPLPGYVRPRRSATS